MANSHVSPECVSLCWPRICKPIWVLVFKQITPLLPFGLPALQPWKHFVPVKEDFSDLVEKLEWARANDDACRAMAARASHFARRFFTEEEILHYVYRVLRHVDTG